MPKGLKTSLISGLAMLAAGPLAAQDRAQVIAVNQALHYFAEQLLEGEADVVFPVPDGVDPSFWRPSISDISTIQSADLILLNGAGFATWIDRVSLPRSRIVNTTAGSEDQFIITESITHSHGDGGEHSHEGLASYTWLDPSIAILQAEAVAAALVSRDLADGSDIEARLDELREELTVMDMTAAVALGDAADVAMIATHPRYQYFARRYGLSIASLEWDANEEPSAEDFAELERLMADVDASILIWEAQPSDAAIAAADALGLQSVVFEPGAGGLSNDSFVAAYRDAVEKLAEAVSQDID